MPFAMVLFVTRAAHSAAHSSFPRSVPAFSVKLAASAGICEKNNSRYSYAPFSFPSLPVIVFIRVLLIKFSFIASHYDGDWRALEVEVRG